MCTLNVATENCFILYRIEIHVFMKSILNNNLMFGFGFFLLENILNVHLNAKVGFDKAEEHHKKEKYHKWPFAL